MSNGKREVCLDCDHWPCICAALIDEDEETNYCRSCGAELREGEEKCRNCGEAVLKEALYAEKNR